MFKSYNNTGKNLPSIFSSWQNFLSARCAFKEQISARDDRLCGANLPTEAAE